MNEEIKEKYNNSGFPLWANYGFEYDL